MFNTKNESINNAIASGAPKNKMTAHKMILHNRISCVVVISIFRFKKYWKIVYNLIDINMSPTFKHFFQAKANHSEENKSYYQWYNVKIIRAFRKQAMAKQQIYKNILAGKSRVYHSSGIHFQKSLVNMDKVKALNNNNQPVKTNQK